MFFKYCNKQYAIVHFVVKQSICLINDKNVPGFARGTSLLHKFDLDVDCRSPVSFVLLLCSLCCLDYVTITAKVCVTIALYSAN